MSEAKKISEEAKKLSRIVTDLLKQLDKNRILAVSAVKSGD
jgi:hypothetical protein